MSSVHETRAKLSCDLYFIVSKYFWHAITLNLTRLRLYVCLLVLGFFAFRGRLKTPSADGLETSRQQGRRGSRSAVPARLSLLVSLSDRCERSD